MSNLSDHARQQVQALMHSALAEDFDDADVLVRSLRGRVVAEHGTDGLPRRLRLLLLLIDGRSSVGELRARLIRFRGLEECLHMLHVKGLIEVVHTRSPDPHGRA